MEPDKWAVIIGANVKSFRLAADLTQGDLAAKIGAKVPAISRLESGTHFPSLATLLRIAEALDIDPCRLLEEQKPKPRKKGE